MSRREQCESTDGSFVQCVVIITCFAFFLRLFIHLLSRPHECGNAQTVNPSKNGCALLHVHTAYSITHRVGLCWVCEKHVRSSSSLLVFPLIECPTTSSCFCFLFSLGPATVSTSASTMSHFFFSSMLSSFRPNVVLSLPSGGPVV